MPLHIIHLVVVFTHIIRMSMIFVHSFDGFLINRGAVNGGSVTGMHLFESGGWNK